MGLGPAALLDLVSQLSGLASAFHTLRISIKMTFRSVDLGRAATRGFSRERELSFSSHWARYVPAICKGIEQSLNSHRAGLRVEVTSAHPVGVRAVLAVAKGLWKGFNGIGDPQMWAL